MRKLLLLFCAVSVSVGLSFGQKNKPKTTTAENKKEANPDETKKNKAVFNFNAGIPDSSFRIKLKTPSYHEGLTYL